MRGSCQRDDSDRQWQGLPGTRNQQEQVTASVPLNTGSETSHSFSAHFLSGWYFPFLEHYKHLKLEKWTTAAAHKQTWSPEELAFKRGARFPPPSPALFTPSSRRDSRWGSVISYLVQNNHYVWERLISKIICLASIKRSNIAKYVSMTFWRIYHIAWV